MPAFLKIDARYMVAMSETGSERETAEALFENWTVQMRKGVLDLYILMALWASDWFGYALVKALVAVPGVAEGAIYPLLARLKRQGLVTTRLEESSEGPARKYYSATAEATALAVEMEMYFSQMVRGVAAFQTSVDFPGMSLKYDMVSEDWESKGR